MAIDPVSEAHLRVVSLRGRVGGLANSGNRKALAVAKRELTAAVEAKRSAEAAQRIAVYVERVVASAPPLTTEQREHIAAILSGGAS